MPLARPRRGRSGRRAGGGHAGTADASPVHHALRPVGMGRISQREAMRVVARRRESSLADELVADAPAQMPDLLERLTVRAAVANLASLDRMLIALRYEHDQTYDRIAELVGLPVGTVTVRLHPARLRLRGDVLAEDRRRRSTSRATLSVRATHCSLALTRCSGSAATRVSYAPAGWTQLDRITGGSSSRICSPPGPVTMSLRNVESRRPAAARPRLAMSWTMRWMRFQPPGSGVRPSGIGRPAELIRPAQRQAQVPRTTSANAGAALERSVEAEVGGVEGDGVRRRRPCRGRSPSS